MNHLAKGETISKANYSPQKEHWNDFQYIKFVFWENQGHHKLLSRFTDL